MADYDVIIVGSGPAGVSAALYTARAGLNTLIISSGMGALEKAEKIENFYGLEKPVSGAELHAIGEKQAMALGVNIVRDQVVSVEYFEDFSVVTPNSSFSSKTLILATGTSRKAPNIKGLSEFEGRGVSYCAVCDAFFYRKKPVAVIGEGEYALKEASELANVTDDVTILTNGIEPTVDMGRFKVIKDKLLEINGEENVSSVSFESGEELRVKGVFVALGVAGSTDIARKIGAFISDGKITVNESLETSVPGLFAAGDCVGGTLQIYKAVRDGAVAARSAIKFIKK
ncbi:MAG: FAD-binding protein [Ruminococcaceae bacterium]|nr:FAD-binding protein [Oscillospiraceae bacterium]